MEFPVFDKRCSKLDCKQLDFLPLQCKCTKLFCSQHFNEHVTNCEELNNASQLLEKIHDLYLCTHEGCNVKCLIPITCEKCLKHFCVIHRHVVSCSEENPNIVKLRKEKSQIPINQFKEAKQNVDKLLDENINKAKKSAKLQETARKVQLMRLKNKATGQKGIATTDRIYFDVHYTKDKPYSISVFVSKTWTLGKAIDVIAEECKLRNNNNQANSSKLRLFLKDTSNMISNDVAKKMEDILNSNQICNGDSLFLDYVSN